MSSLINKLFSGIETTDSILVISFLVGAFIIGWLTGFLMRNYGFRAVKKKLVEKETELVGAQNSLIAYEEEKAKQGLTKEESAELATLRSVIKEVENRNSLLQNEIVEKNHKIREGELLINQKDEEIDHIKGELLAKEERGALNPASSKGAEAFTESGMTLRFGDQSYDDYELIKARLDTLQDKNDKLFELNEQLQAQNEEYALRLGTGSSPAIDLKSRMDDFEPDLDISRRRITGGNNQDQHSRDTDGRIGELERRIKEIEAGGIVGGIGADYTDVELDFDIHKTDEVLSEDLSKGSISGGEVRSPLGQLISERLPAAVPNQADDLKRIDGIGSFIEKKLNEIGIFTYNQISNLDDDLIEKITHAIQFFPGRIKKDDWVGQARRYINRLN